MAILRLFKFIAASIVVLPAYPVLADVAVLANRTHQELIVQIASAGERERTISIPERASRPVFFQRTVTVRFGPILAPQRYDLVHGAAYFFSYERDGQTLRMERIGLGPSDLQEAEHLSTGPLKIVRNDDVPYTVPVKIAVDEDEPTHRTIWEPRLRERLEAASQIIEQHCGVKFSVQSVVTWDSDNRYRDFVQSMREFEHEVVVRPRELVIGFSSQYDFTTVERMHLGGSRGPLHPYILLKERAPNVREPEKLELLVHELCHYLGAAHSPEPTSVMRPVLSVSQLRTVDGRIYIDPVNALLMALMGNEFRQEQVRHFADVSHPTKERMGEIYKVLQEALPSDPAAGHLQQLVGIANSPQLTMEVREIITQLTQFAKLESARASKVGIKVAGDDLTARYVQEAAAIAKDFHSPNSARAMLLALGLFMDDSTTLRSFPATRDLALQVETDQQLQNRLSVIGQPAMHGRPDLAKHFFVSAHLTAVMGGEAARNLGLMKEFFDSNGGSGFSFVDMTANRAGIIFAEKLLSAEIDLEQIVSSFAVSSFIPEIGDVAEGLQAAALRAEIGDPRTGLSAELRRCEDRIQALPIYQKSSRK